MLLPPPRTVLGALTRGLGISLGIKSGEERVKRKLARITLTEAVECSSYAFVRPLSPLVKTSQILRIVPGIEKAEGLIDPSRAHDAFKHDVVFSNEMEIVYAINFAELNERLSSYGLRKVAADDIAVASRMIDRIGPTEAFCHVINAERVEPLRIGAPATINTYVPIQDPAKWVEPLQRGEQNYLVEPLYPNLRVLGMKTLSTKSRREKISYVLPIACTRRRRGREIFECSEVLVRPMKGYSIYSLGNGESSTRVILPENEVAENDVV